MKKIISLLIFLVLLGNVLAQNDAAPTTETSDEVDVGITPDSAFYGLENAFKKVSLALTFSKEKKARKELSIAKERLREVKLMIEENKLDAAEKARIRHEMISEKLKERFENDVDGDDQEVELQAEIENELDDQEIEIEDIKTKIEIKGELTEEQRAKLMELIENLKSTGNDVRLKVDLRKDRLKIKLEEKGINKEELEKRMMEMKENGLDIALKNRIAHVRREIEKSRDHLNVNKDNIKDDNLAELRGQLDTADETLIEAEKKIEEKKFDESKELINQALRLAVLVRGDERRFEANREILKKELKKEIGEDRLERAREKLEEREKLLINKRMEEKEKLEERMIKDSEDDDELEDETDDEFEETFDDEDKG